MSRFHATAASPAAGTCGLPAEAAGFSRAPSHHRPRRASLPARGTRPGGTVSAVPTRGRPAARGGSPPGPCTRPPPPAELLLGLRTGNLAHPPPGPGSRLPFLGRLHEGGDLVVIVLLHREPVQGLVGAGGPERQRERDLSWDTPARSSVSETPADPVQRLLSDPSPPQTHAGAAVDTGQQGPVPAGHSSHSGCRSPGSQESLPARPTGRRRPDCRAAGAGGPLWGGGSLSGPGGVTALPPGGVCVPQHGPRRSCVPRTPESSHPPLAPGAPGAAPTWPRRW